MLGKSSVYLLDGKELTIRELVVSEIATLLDRMEEYEPHVFDILLAEEIPVSAVIVSTGLSEEELMAIPCTELEQIYREVEKVNPHLDALIERLKNFIEKQPEILSVIRRRNSSPSGTSGSGTTDTASSSKRSTASRKAARTPRKKDKR